MASLVAGLTPLYGKAFPLTNGGSAGRLPWDGVFTAPYCPLRFAPSWLEPLDGCVGRPSAAIAASATAMSCSTAGARSDSADDAPVEHDGYAATEDDNFAGITFLNTEKWLPRLR